MFEIEIKKIFDIIICAIITFCIFFVSGCNNNGKIGTTSDNIDDKWIIAVTIIPEKTFVEAVCGELAEVITLIPPGNSPENYEPTPKEMEKLSKASLYFSVGVPTEEANILPNVGDIKVISLAKEVAAIYPERIFESGGRDPHIWLSPKRVKIMIETIAREMGNLDKVNRDKYDENAKNYIKQVDALDQQIISALDGVQNKKFIVYHPAFGYIADDYNIEMYSLEEEGKEATARHLQDMVDLAKKEGIKVLFYQEEIDGRQSEAFAEEIGGKTICLAPLAEDYIGNLKKMAETIAEAME